MNNDTKTDFFKQGFLFFSSVNSDFKFILDVATDLLDKHPDILNWIKKDQDKVSKEKKRQRILDRQFEENKTKSLISEKQLNEILGNDCEEELILKTGRKRMPPIIVFLFFVFRGYYGSFTKKQNFDFIRESITIQNWLAQYGINKLPGETTILENVNMISSETYEKILTLQCEMIKEEGFDDFSKAFIDSTSVAGNTAYPTDITVLYKLLFRSTFNAIKLSQLFDNPITKNCFDGWFKEMKKCIFSIAMGKLKPKKKKKVCKNLFALAGKIQNRLLIKLADREIESQQTFSLIRPSCRFRLEAVFSEIKTDLEESKQVLEYAYKSIIDGKKFKSKEKILSVSDANVGFIKKGSLRTAVIGYKPQVVRSGSGIITAILFPEGNTSDAAELIPVLEQAIERTGVVPEMLSTDDGYPSEENLEWLQKTGVKINSFNGAKGRKLTSEEDWESTAYQIARAERSMIEGLFSTLKTVQGFGKLSRRGLENGKSEMLEKVLAQNFYRIGILRKRCEEETRLKDVKRKKKKKTIIQSVYRIAIEPESRTPKKAAA